MNFRYTKSLKKNCIFINEQKGYFYQQNAKFTKNMIYVRLSIL
jgi:hypothetical protein